MGTPTTLRERIDRYAEDLLSDPALFGGLLDRMIEKTARNKIPAKVEEIADAIRRDTGVGDESAYRMAWQTYSKHVNPGYAGCLEFGGTGKMGEPLKISSARPRKGTKAEIEQRIFKSAAAEDLADKLAERTFPPASLADIRKRTEGAKGRMREKRSWAQGGAAAAELARRLGIA